MMPSRNAAIAIWIALKKAPSGSGPVGDVLQKDAAQLRFRMLKAQFVRAGSHDHHDVGAWLQLCTMQSKKFTHEPLRPVPLDRSADLATRRDSEACLAGRAGTLEHQKMAARPAVPSALDSKEILARPDAARPCQPTIRATCVRAWAASRRSVASCPWRGVSSAPACHQGWPYGHGNHDGVAAGDCWAGRFSSR
jgi:hypothetical protein